MGMEMGMEMARRLTSQNGWSRHDAMNTVTVRWGWRWRWRWRWIDRGPSKVRDMAAWGLFGDGDDMVRSPTKLREKSNQYVYEDTYLRK